MKIILACLLPFFIFTASAQPVAYTVNNAHSHNDYQQDIPFQKAYTEGFASIEVDIFFKDNNLLVAHEERSLSFAHTLQAMYLDPILECIKKNKGYIFADTTKHLQLLIDIKTDSINTLNKLVEVLKHYPLLINNRSIKFVITGNRPDAVLFKNYPSFIWFDGELHKNYNREALKKIALLSDNFKDYSTWNGKGNPIKKEWDALQGAVEKAHHVGKPVRFWAAPDFINAWYQLMQLQVDYINTDHIYALSSFMRTLYKTSYIAASSYKIYQPLYKTDGVDKPVKNVILLIGDGTGLAQLYAGYTANKGALNIFSMRNMGLSKTSSYDNYNTDSAPGSTALSSGVKTNNRFVGTDHTGVALPLLPFFLAKRKIKTGLVTCGNIADATPADFYAHQVERSNATGILKDLKYANVDILMGADDEEPEKAEILKESGETAFNKKILQDLQSVYSIVSSIDSVTDDINKKWIIIDKRAALPALKGRGEWLSEAFTKSLEMLSKNSAGFFLMTEGAQVDHGGHDNNMPYVCGEVMDFDQVVGKALKFADENGETLVIVTADHETGGLTLLDGNYSKGYVGGQFSTNDHTGIPVPVFAYGPQSQLFRGVYENTALFDKIMQAYNISVK